MDLSFLSAFASPSSAPSRSRKSKGIYGSWKNNTSGIRIDRPRSIKVRSRESSPSLVKPVSVRLSSFYLSDSLDPEWDIRYFLGKSLYLERGELIRELKGIYSCSSSACFLASVSQLRRWLHCYQVREDFLLCSRYIK
jgi:hypothetical protein